jgi:hypothetical protein
MRSRLGLFGSEAGGVIDGRQLFDRAGCRLGCSGLVLEPIHSDSEDLELGNQAQLLHKSCAVVGWIP